MSDALIVRRTISGGGGLSNTDAVLIVSALTGSTVTAAKNGTTLTPTMWVQSPDSTRDTAIFNIPSSLFDSNAWTVTAALGVASKSVTIVINSARAYEISLDWTFYLIKGAVKCNGYDFTSTVTTVRPNGGSSGSQSWSPSSGYVTIATSQGVVSVFSSTTTVDLTNYNTVHARVNVLDPVITDSSLPEKLRGVSLFPLYPARPKVGSNAALAQYIDTYTNVTSSGETTMNLDVSGLTGGYYINLSLAAYIGGYYYNMTIYLYDLYLD